MNMLNIVAGRMEFYSLVILLTQYNLGVPRASPMNWTEEHDNAIVQANPGD